MGGGASSSFEVSFASFCMALLNAYYQSNQHFKLFRLFMSPISNKDNKRLCDGVKNPYLCLNLPKFSFFSAVHLTIDDQNVWQTSDVACLHLKRDTCSLSSHYTCVSAPSMCEYKLSLTVGWYFSQFSHHAWVLCSRQMLFFRISAKSCSFITFSVESKGREVEELSCSVGEQWEDSHLWIWKKHLELTLRVLFRVVHGKEQREGWADRFLCTAAQTAVLHLTAEQLSNDGFHGGAQRAAEINTAFILDPRTPTAPVCFWSLLRPAASSPVGLWTLLLLRLLVELGEYEAIPALDEATQFGFARLLIGVREDQTQSWGFRDGAKRSEKVTSLSKELKNWHDKATEVFKGDYSKTKINNYLTRVSSRQI